MDYTDHAPRLKICSKARLIIIISLVAPSLIIITATFNDRLAAVTSQLLAAAHNSMTIPPPTPSLAYKFNEISNLEYWSTRGDQAWEAFFPHGKSRFLWVQNAETEAWGVSIFTVCIV
ncbi:hypothetical protein ETB97_001652 [Aspergillus alliaceus]|uniref:Uncharacterized protein n=1 Tax=Petromyces alliaceus TaxID=209559 RepID=A0A8H6A3K6_PETAA|nr:hypothetical protein ETB97_001652 [Aspergillus burnettii]